MRRHAKYVEIADKILSRIRDLPPGSRCPGVNQVTHDYHVARATAERVLNLLARQGHVCQVTGKGTFVAGPQVRKVAILTRPGPSASEAESSPALAERIAERLLHAGHQVQVLRWIAQDAPAVDHLGTFEPDLVVTVGISNNCHLEQLAQAGCPIICVDFVPFDLAADSVASATLRSGYMVTRALLEASLPDTWYVGAYAGWPDASIISLTHSIGFHAACRDAGLEDPASRVRMARCDDDLDRIVREFFSHQPQPRALVAADAGIACRFLAAAVEGGVSVPGDLAIVAASSREVCPVSCLVPDRLALALAAVEAIQRRIRQPDLPPQHVLVLPTLQDAGTIPPVASQSLHRMLPGHTS